MPFATPGYLADAIDPAQLKRALVIKLRHHGDVLLASPVPAALKAAAPQCEIDALVFADTAAMLSGHPALAQLHTLDRGAKKLGLLAQWRAERTLYRTLKARGYDLIVHLTDHPRGAWLTRLLKPRWAVAPQRKGNPGWWKKSFTHLFKTVGGGRRHTVEMHLDALRRLGIQPAETARRLVLVAGAEAEASLQAKLRTAGLDERPFIHFHPASRWFFKCWPVARNAALLAALVARGETVVLSAAPDEREHNMISAILRRSGVAGSPQLIDLAGQLSLKEMAALSARAQLFVGVDSAPMHIAAAVGTPCVALFGPSGDREWHPWMVPQRVITSDHPCRPCGLDGCGGGKLSDCLVSIPEQRVLAAIDELLGDLLAEDPRR